MFGSPTINRDALKHVWDLISSMDAITKKASYALYLAHMAGVERLARLLKKGLRH